MELTVSTPDTKDKTAFTAGLQVLLYIRTTTAYCAPALPVYVETDIAGMWRLQFRNSLNIKFRLFLCSALSYQSMDRLQNSQI